MIPAAFDYKAPTSLDDALQLLAQGGDDAKIIAGGQSLLPVLKLRLAAPELLIDLAKIDSLKGVRDDGDAIVIGAMTPYFEVLRDPLIAEHATQWPIRKSGIEEPLAGLARTPIQPAIFPHRWWPWTPNS
jgi:carbon-monoxide dehydrogenase medium subunit